MIEIGAQWSPAIRGLAPRQRLLVLLTLSSATPGPLDLQVLLDASTSMDGDRTRRAREIFLDLARRKLRRGDTLEAYTFSRSVTPIDPSHVPKGRNALAELLASRPVGGPTCLEQAVRNVSEARSGATDARARALCIIGDGEASDESGLPSANPAGLEGALGALAERGVLTIALCVSAKPRTDALRRAVARAGGLWVPIEGESAPAAPFETARRSGSALRGASVEISLADNASTTASVREVRMLSPRARQLTFDEATNGASWTFSLRDAAPARAEIALEIDTTVNMDRPRKLDLGVAIVRDARSRELARAELAIECRGDPPSPPELLSSRWEAVTGADAATTVDGAAPSSRAEPVPLSEQLAASPDGLPPEFVEHIVLELARELATMHAHGEAHGAIRTDRVLSPPVRLELSSPGPRGSANGDVHDLGLLARTLLTGSTDPAPADPRWTALRWRRPIEECLRPDGERLWGAAHVAAWLSTPTEQQPVLKLEGIDREGELELRWDWPRDATTALVAWRHDALPLGPGDPAARTRLLTRSEYSALGKFVFPEPARRPYYFGVWVRRGAGAPSDFGQAPPASDSAYLFRRLGRSLTR